jgi:predicted small secreted protein
VTKGRVIILLLLVILLTCTLLSGCIETEGVGQVRQDKPIGEIYGAKTVGQTFVSTQPSLDRIDILLATYERTNTEEIIFHLRSSPNSPNDLPTPLTT